MVEHEVGYVTVAPFLEEARISVLAFGVNPHVKALGHHHNAHRVAHVHLHCRGHVVGGTYGVAAHFLHYADLADERRLVFCRSEGAEVVVKAHALYLPALAVKAEAVLRRHVNGAYAHALCYRVNLPAACRYGGCEGIEIRRFGRPKLRIVNLAGHGRASV